MENIDKNTGVIIRYDNNNHPYVSMPVGKIPFKLWQEWESDCKQSFGGNRWAKIYHDHQKVKEFDLQTEVELLKQEILKGIENDKQEVKPDLMNGERLNR